MGLPRISEVGKLWKDPEIRWTSGGKAVCTLPLVFAKRKKDEQTGKWEDVATLWLRGTVWGDTAEHASNSLSKGDQVMVTGEIFQREYQDNEGNKRTSLELKIYDVGPVIRYGPVKVERAERGQASATADDPFATSAEDAPF